MSRRIKPKSDTAEISNFFKRARKAVASNVLNSSLKPDVWRNIKTLWREKE